MAECFYVHRALKYVIHQRNRRTDNNKNNNNNDNNDNDNNDNSNSNNKMEPKIIKDIHNFTFALGLYFPISFQPSNLPRKWPFLLYALSYC